MLTPVWNPTRRRDDYMQTPEKRSQVRPAPSHSLFVVYDRGEAPGYEVSYDSRVAIPVTYSRHGGAAHLDRLEGHGVTLRHGASSRRRSRWSPDGVRDEARGDLRACFDRRRHVVHPLRRPQDGIEIAAAGRVPLLSAPAAAVLEPPLSALSADHRRGPRHPVAKPSRSGPRTARQSRRKRGAGRRNLICSSLLHPPGSGWCGQSFGR